MKIFKSNRKQSGQVLIEYMLLLTISVGLATLLVTSLISRKDGSEGIIIRSWSKILQSIGNDIPECPSQTEFVNPKCP